MSNPIFEIPLSAAPQSFLVTLAGTEYRMRLVYRNAAEAGWTLDLSTNTGIPLVAGIPLVTGCNLLQQYKYLGIAGELRVLSDVDLAAVPTFANLGTASHLYFQAS